MFACTIALASASAAFGQTTVNVSTGGDFTSGDYGGTTTTDVWSVPLQIGVRHHPWSARVTISHVWIRGDARLIDRAQAIADPTVEPGTRRSAHGVGDVVLSAARTFTLPVGNGRVPPTYMDARINLKLPTANEDKGLGTGRADFAMQADLYSVVGDFTPFATAGYRWRGSRPDLRLEDGWFALAGLGYTSSERLRFGAFLSWREPASKRSDDGLEVAPYLSFDLGRSWRVLGYGRAGLADGSPDAGAGVRLRYQFKLEPAPPRIQMQ